MLPPKVVTDWGQRPPRCGDPNPLGVNTTLFVHFSDTEAEGIDKRGEPKQAARNIQNFHMDDRGWCDLGYSWLLFQQRGIFKRPLLLKGRGWNVVPASQEGSNSGHVSVCVIADGNDKIKRSTYQALAWLVRRCPARFVKGHRDAVATGCPGDRLYSKVPALNRAAKRPKLRFLS